MSYETHIQKMMEFGSEPEDKWLTWLHAAEENTCDHDFDDYSYSNTNSGCDHFVCKKCHIEFYHRMY